MWGTNHSRQVPKMRFYIEIRSITRDEFCVLLIILVGILLFMRTGAYWALTTSSTFPPLTPKITNVDLKWYYR